MFGNNVPIVCDIQMIVLNIGTDHKTKPIPVVAH